MTKTLKVGIVAAALVATTSLVNTANAGGVIEYEPVYASTKDGGYVSMKDAVAQPSRSCYLRADVGYSWSDDPSVGYTNTVGATFGNRKYGDTFFGEFGAGCALGMNLRGELSAAFRGDNDFTWYPDPVDPIFTSVNSNTFMANLYYDIGDFHGFTPYVGAGVGFAHHDVENVIFQNAGALGNNPQFGKESYEFAWSLMAGVEKQISPNMSLDLGYRYIDMGDAESRGLDNTGFINPPLELDNITAHELKVGVRYQIGSLFH